MESYTCNFYLSVAARQIVWADPSLRYTRMLQGRSATNKQNNITRAPFCAACLYKTKYLAPLAKTSPPGVCETQVRTLFLESVFDPYE